MKKERQPFGSEIEIFRNRAFLHTSGVKACVNASAPDLLLAPLRQRVQTLILGAAMWTQPSRMRRTLRPCLAVRAHVLKGIAALHLLSLCGGAWLSHSVRLGAFGHAGGARLVPGARSAVGEMPRPYAFPPASSCLRLRGGKVKYKDLKVVKKAREEGLRVKGENGPAKPRHRAGTRSRERRASEAAAHGEASGSAAQAQEVRIGDHQRPPQAKARGGRRARKREDKDESSDGGLLPDDQAY